MSSFESLKVQFLQGDVTDRYASLSCERNHPDDLLYKVSAHFIAWIQSYRHFKAQKCCYRIVKKEPSVSTGHRKSPHDHPTRVHTRPYEQANGTLVYSRGIPRPYIDTLWPIEAHKIFRGNFQNRRDWRPTYLSTFQSILEKLFFDPKSDPRPHDTPIYGIAHRGSNTRVVGSRNWGRPGGLK